MAYSDSIPIVDAAALFHSANRPAKRRMISEMRAACLDTGMFYLDGHGIPPRILRAVYLCSTGFFSLPAEFKTHISLNAIGQGYIAARRSVFDSVTSTSPEEYYSSGGVIASHLFEERGARGGGHADHGAAVIEKYYDRILTLGSLLLDALSQTRGLAEAYRCVAKHPMLYAQLLSCGPAAPASLPQRGRRQFDAHPLVILWRDGVQDVRISGMARLGNAPADLRGPFAVKAADMMARWSSDLLVCAPHLVTDEAGHEHYRIPVFHDPNDDTRVDCVEHCAGKGQAADLARLM
jgi:isopenicillin N synthase-like dioxygenase